MTPDPMPTAQAVRALRRDLSGARADQIARVVAMVDGLAERGEADALVAPLRPRLAEFGVRRPLTLGRLLFMPLDPVLLDGPEWRRGSPGVPRTALPSVARLVRARLGDAAARIEAGLAGRAADDAAAVAETGPGLWDRAAAVLAAAAPPDGWTDETGLTPGDANSLLRTIGFALSLASAVRTLAARQEALEEADEGLGHLLDAMLAQREAEDATPLATLVALLLLRLGRADLVLDAFEARETEARRATMRAARDAALAFVLARLAAARPGGSSLGAAARAVQRQAGLLQDLANWARHRPHHAPAIAEAGRQVEALCRTRFVQAAAGLDRDGDAPVNDADVAESEQLARDLRRFEHAARGIGGAEQYDRTLREAARAIAARTAPGWRPADRLRLLELLVGPAEAMALRSSLVA